MHYIVGVAVLQLRYTVVCHFARLSMVGTGYSNRHETLGIFESSSGSGTVEGNRVTVNLKVHPALEPGPDVPVDVKIRHYLLFLFVVESNKVNHRVPMSSAPFNILSVDHFTMASTPPTLTASMKRCGLNERKASTH